MMPLKQLLKLTCICIPGKTMHAHHMTTLLHSLDILSYTIAAYIVCIQKIQDAYHLISNPPSLYIALLTKYTTF